MQLKVFSILIALAVFLPVFPAGCTADSGLPRELRAIAGPDIFSIAGWELRTLPGELEQALVGTDPVLVDDTAPVLEYFELTSRIKTTERQIALPNTWIPETLDPLKIELAGLMAQREALTETVERILSKQIRSVLEEQGIINPLVLPFPFPPINFTLDELPHLLVVSPRGYISSIEEITLVQELPVERMEEIEAQADALGVSSLVVELGGFGGTYPTFVVNDSGLAFTIDTAIEEWLHQYLAFTPLGFRYVLDVTGIHTNYEIATMNETVAGMVSGELGERVREKYYPDYLSGNSNTTPEFDFNAEMRTIRRIVDEYLARGEVEQAEEYMEVKRRYLQTKGYYIRKLNQAYFAFHGMYGAEPTSISPIGGEIADLRSRSASLREFLFTASSLTGRDDLQRILEQQE